MADGRHIAYYRVSTVRQGRSGLGLEAQRAAVLEYLNGGSWALTAEFTEVESGKVNERPKLTEALRMCRLTGARLVIARLDRLSRDSHFLIGLQRSDVSFVAADMPTANELTVGIMAVVAQAERKACSSRTTAALAAAKARGTKLGGWRPNCQKVDPALGTKAIIEKSDAFAGSLSEIVLPLRAQGASLRGIAAELTTRSIQTPRGGAWTAHAVRMVLARLEPAAA